VSNIRVSEPESFLTNYPNIRLHEIAWSTAFSPVDEYFKFEATMDSSQNVVGVLIAHQDSEVMAFIASAVGRMDLSKVMAVYPGEFSPDKMDIPYLYLQQFGTKCEMQGQGLGTRLLLQLYRNVLKVRQELGIGVAGIIVHARPEDETIMFYWNKGFRFLEAKDFVEFEPNSTEPGFAVNRQDA
jgi:hypothetical protein